jgi:phosphatidylglycerol:prolipoprotein diacylglycerol transferase
MHPILLDFGIHDLPFLGSRHLFLPTYGLLFATAVVLAWWWFLKRAQGLGVEPDAAFNLTFYALLGGLLGAKLSLVAVDLGYYLANPTEVLSLFRVAGVLMGGVAAGALVFIFYCRARGLPLHDLGDAIAAPLALAQGIGRIGCLSAGCCWGVEVSRGSACALTFTDPAAAAQTGVPLNVPLFPAQVVEMAADLSLAALLTVLYRRRPRPSGTVFWCYVLLYSLLRGTIEFWRGDRQRGLWLGDAVSTSQLIAVLCAAVAIVMLAAGLRRRRGTAAA